MQNLATIEGFLLSLVILHGTVALALVVIANSLIDIARRK